MRIASLFERQQLDEDGRGVDLLILPAADIGANATVGPASLVMRGETARQARKASSSAMRGMPKAQRTPSPSSCTTAPPAASTGPRTAR